MIKISLSFLPLVFRAGGPWLVTDMDRIESIFVIKPSLRVNLSDLSLVK